MRENEFFYKNIKLCKIVMGIVWCIGAIVFLEFLLTDDPFAIESVLCLPYFVGVIPFFLVYQSRDFNVSKQLEKGWLYLYLFNIGIMLCEVFVTKWILHTNFGFAPWVRECSILFYWIMSIPLTVIRNEVFWILHALSIYSCSLIYFSILNIYSNVTNNSIGFILINVVIVIVSLIVSVSMTLNQLKKYNMSIEQKGTDLKKS